MSDQKFGNLDDFGDRTRNRIKNYVLVATVGAPEVEEARNGVVNNRSPKGDLWNWWEERDE